MEAVEQAFALALFDIARQKNKEDLFSDLLADLIEAQDAQPDLGLFLNHPKVDKTAKADLLIEILPEGLDEDFAGFLQILAQYNEAGHLKAIYDDYRKLVDESRNVETVTIQTARPLAEGQLERLKASLEKKLNKTLRVKTEVVPDLIGGLRIETDGYSLDASFKKRLDSLKEQLLK